MSVSMLLGFVTLGFLLLLLLGKTLTAWELRSLESEYRYNQSQIGEREEDLETSRRRYLIALKAEGVAKHRVSQERAKIASLKQHLEQLEQTVVQQEAQKQRSVEQKLEGLVMNALGGPSVRRDSQFKRVMKMIHQLIDLEEESNNENLIAAIQEKIAGMGREGLIEAADRGNIAASAGGEAADAPDGDETLTPSPEEAPGEADEEKAPEPSAPKAAEESVADEVSHESAEGADGEDTDSQPAEKGAGRRDRVREAMTRKRH